MYHIDQLISEQAHRLLPQLVQLLQDAVDGGASLGFWPPLSADTAHGYWRGVLDEVAQQTRILLAALEEGQLVGSVQLALATKQNALHRAEVQKLCVLTSARNRGIGRALMHAVEDAARAAGRTLLVLDTRRGDAAEQLYASHGYTRLGVIPQYVRDADGVTQDTVVFYRLL